MSLDAVGVEPVRDSRRRVLERAHRSGGAALGPVLECLTAGLHQDDDEARERLVEHERTDDRERRDDVAREPAMRHVDGGAHYRDAADEHEPRDPDRAVRRGFAQREAEHDRRRARAPGAGA